MLKIKLARFGKRNQPHYRVVVNEARDKRDGSYVASIGHYAPTQQPKILEIDLKAYKEWVARGAQPTDTVRQLAARFESGNPFPEKKPKLSKKAKAKLEAEKAAKEAPAEVATEETPEKPAEEPKVEETEDSVETVKETKEEESKEAAAPAKEK